MQVYSYYLFAINQGSNSLSMLVINPSDATSVTLNTTVPVVGRYPVSMAVSSTHACVLTTGIDSVISCFNYSSLGLSSSPTASFNVTLYLATNYPFVYGPPKELLFSKDGRILITAISGYSATILNRILFIRLDNGALTLSNDHLLNNSQAINSMTLVDTNSLLIVSGQLSSGTAFSQFLNYSLTNTTVTATLLSPLSQPLLGAIYYPVYSPKTGNYYGLSPYWNSYLVEVKLNLNTTPIDPFFVGSYYPSLCTSSNPNDATIVTSGDTDYMIVVNADWQLMNSYQFKAGSDPTANCFTSMQVSSSSVNRVAGVAAYIQTGTSTSTSVRVISSWVILTVISLIHLF
jgi:hypothetical protein